MQITKYQVSCNEHNCECRDRYGFCTFNKLCTQELVEIARRRYPQKLKAPHLDAEDIDELNEAMTVINKSFPPKINVL